MSWTYFSWLIWYRRLFWQVADTLFDLPEANFLFKLNFFFMIDLIQKAVLTGCRHIVWPARSKCVDPDFCSWRIQKTRGTATWQNPASKERLEVHSLCKLLILFSYVILLYHRSHVFVIILNLSIYFNSHIFCLPRNYFYSGNLDHDSLFYILNMLELSRGCLYVCVCVCVHVCVCVSALQPKRLVRFWWKFTLILSRMSSCAIFLIFLKFELMTSWRPFFTKTVPALSRLQYISDFLYILGGCSRCNLFGIAFQQNRC